METVKIKQISLLITHRCTLKCKLCAIYSPYYSPPMYFSFDYLSKVISNIFDVIDIVEKFSINGGEPLLHPQLPEIINQSNAENDEEMLPHVHMIASLLKR